jgi:hypothetical protein
MYPALLRVFLPRFAIRTVASGWWIVVSKKLSAFSYQLRKKSKPIPNS